MIHLLPLPGSPHHKNSMKEIESAALHDLHALENGGANAAIIENFGDIPYTTQVSVVTFAAMCSIATKIAERASIPLGINIQYNCVEYEWALACAIGAKFIRVEAFVENRAGAHGVAVDGDDAVVAVLAKAAAPAAGHDVVTREVFVIVRMVAAKHEVGAGAAFRRHHALRNTGTHGADGNVGEARVRLGVARHQGAWIVDIGDPARRRHDANGPEGA